MRRTDMAKQKYLFTEEWWEGGKAEVAAYGKRSEKEIDDLCEQMDKYSPFDYACPNIFDNESDYLSALQARINDGCKVEYHVTKK